MPNVPKTPIQRFRLDAEDWEAFGRAVPSDTDRSAVLRHFVNWYIHKPGVTRPNRPTTPPPPKDAAEQ
jgi:hypothetical protein